MSGTKFLQNITTRTNEKKYDDEFNNVFLVNTPSTSENTNFNTNKKENEILILREDDNKKEPKKSQIRRRYKSKKGGADKESNDKVEIDYEYNRKKYKLIPDIRNTTDFSNNVKVVVPTESNHTDHIFRESNQIYAYDTLFKVEMLEVIVLLGMITISLLALTEFIDISTRLYLLIGAVVNAALLVVVHFPLIVMYMYNKKHANFTHNHVKAITYSFIFNIIGCILIYLSMGFWVRDYTDDYSVDSDVFDDHAYETGVFSRFATVHTIVVCISTLVLTFYFESLWAYMHPEIVVHSYDNIIVDGSPELKRVDVDESDEINTTDEEEENTL